MIMAALWNRAGHYIFVSETGCLPYFHTWCGLSANLECRSEMCCTRLAGNTGCKGSPYCEDMWRRYRLLASLGPQQLSMGFASWLRYFTEVAQRRSTKLCTMFGRLLGWYTIFFGGSCPLTEFCQVQHSLCIQVLRSPILAGLLHAWVHGTRALGVS